jgi:molybdenum cofactor cytidylyltransferase
MTQSPKLCGVILAAGSSSRMGTDKALLSWPPAVRAEAGPPGHTLLSAAIATLKPQTNAVIVVAGRNTAALAPIIAAAGALLAVNPEPERGQFSSLQTGLREAVASDYHAVMITPVDCPPLAEATLQRLRTAFDRAIAGGKWAVAPEHSGRHGHPLLAGRELINAFLEAPVSGIAREIMHAHEQMIEYVPVDESLVGVDLNTPEAYAALTGEAEV